MTEEKNTTQVKPAEKAVKINEAKPAKPKAFISGNKPLVTEVQAKARFIRVAPRKVRLVINQLKGRPVVEALGYLQFIRKAAVRPITKLVNSAVANAENNFRLDRKDLYIKSFTADDGPILKRYKPRAHGRSNQISKRTSHLKIILGVKAGAKIKSAAEKKITEENKDIPKVQEPKEAVKIVSPAAVKKSLPKISGRGPEEKGKSSKGFFNKIFNRKTG